MKNRKSKSNYLFPIIAIIGLADPDPLNDHFVLDNPVVA
jgi:hypothetical protein